MADEPGGIGGRKSDSSGKSRPVRNYRTMYLRLIDEMVEKQTNRQRLSNWFTFVSIAVGIAAALIGFFLPISLGSGSGGIDQDLTIQIQALGDELDRMIARAAALEEQVVSVQEPMDVALATGELKRRLDLIESALMADPEKMLSIPLMRKDFDNLAVTTAKDVADVRAQIARIDSFQGWFFALIGTMALTVIGTALAQFFKPTKAVLVGDRKELVATQLPREDDDDERD